MDNVLTTVFIICFSTSTSIVMFNIIYYIPRYWHARNIMVKTRIWIIYQFRLQNLGSQPIIKYGPRLVCYAHYNIIIRFPID